MDLKQGKNFLLLGSINFIITNIFLQLFLLKLPIIMATFLSQIINISLGYFLYSYFVFKVKKNSYGNILKYLILAFVLWQLNSFLILKISTNFLISKNIAALLIIPLLTFLSFLSQKYFIFKKN